MKLLSSFLAAMVLSCGVAQAAQAPLGDIQKATIYLSDFEKEVERSQGASGRFFNRDEALSRIQTLVLNYPDDPRVQELYKRASVALMKSKGGFLEITPEMVQYKKNEKQLVEHIAQLADAKWRSVSRPDNLLSPAFPAPDADHVVIEDFVGKTVVLENVRWPGGQFIGSSGQLVAVGKPSTGYYYISAGGRDWLGAYEAVKRYRRLVDSSLKDDLVFTLVGKIKTAVMEQPDASNEKKAPFAWGWMVEPEYLYIPGHVLAWKQDGGEHGGTFEGESEVASIKDGWFTIKSVPDDASPEQVLMAFYTAIKEKNYDLYKSLIHPDMSSTPVGESELVYHWDLHQMRFSREYVAATFDKADIVVEKGFDSGNQLENFFLDASSKDKLIKMQGQKKERAYIVSKAYDENGKQLGSPNRHELVRVGDGRWYVQNYMIRF